MSDRSQQEGRLQGTHKQANTKWEGEGGGVSSGGGSGALWVRVSAKSIHMILPS